MSYLKKVVLSLLLLSVALPAVAQGPGSGGRRGGFMGGGGSPEQLMGLFAFDEQLAVTDGQFIKLRQVLKDIHLKQQSALAEMRNGAVEREEFIETFTALRDEVMEQTATVLSATQMEALTKRIEQTRERRGGRGARGGR